MEAPKNVDERTRLNLGSGKAYDPEAINLDVTSDTSPDIVHDLNVIPWPFADDSLTEIRAIDVIEHLADPIAALGEIHRIARHDARVQIVVPHFSSANAHTDPTHRTSFGWSSFDYVTGDHHHDYYTRVRFRYASREIVFSNAALSSKIVRRLAKRWPERYEARWPWIFPAWFLSFELRAVKQ